MRGSAASMKGGRGASSPLRDRPRSGTKIGNVYDLFLSRPCEPVHIHTINFMLTGRPGTNYWARCLESLLNYGLDIRHHSRGWWWLVAADGHDFMAERLKSEAA